MIQRLHKSLVRDHVLHLAAVQLALGVVLSASLAITAAAKPQALLVSHPAPRLAAAAPIQPAAAAAPAEPEVIRLQDLAPEAARRWNAANPISTLPNPAAKPFRLKTEGVLDESRAVDCMTAAIYYEAAYESLDGQRAVAQVVLNRMRHPAFAKTVCGVVFQGSERTTGCQFTFTCDGALSRPPRPELWARARTVAAAALDGYVMKKVGNATHYHAVYVAPYWSPDLVKVAAIGAHVFYRWTGGWGLPPAFAGRYAGGETSGVKIATLDALPRDGDRLALAAGGEAAAPATLAGAEPAAAVAPAGTDDLVTAAAATPPPQALLQPQDLDWTGQPKPKTPPRLARPSETPTFQP